MQNKILITGATGFVGSAVRQACIKVGEKTICPVRTPRDGQDFVHVSEWSAETNWADHLPGVEIIIHCAARVHVMRDKASNPIEEFRRVNVDLTLNLARQAASSGVKQFIYLSSVKVNGELTQLKKGHVFSEADEAAPQDPYGQSKFEAEQALLALAQETGMKVTIIRPPLIYGPGVKANFLNMLKAVRRGIPLPLGLVKNLRSLVYIGNLCDLILRTLRHPAAYNQVLMVSDGMDVSTPELLRAVARAFGKRIWLLPIPVFVLTVLGFCVGKRAAIQRLTGSLQVDIRETRERLSWHPPYSLHQGLQATINALQKQNETPTRSPY